MAHTKSLTGVQKGDLALAGRRGTDLALLAESKFLVPDTMLILSTAYDAVVQENNLQPKIDFVMRHAQADNAASMMNAYSGVRRALAEAKLPAQVETELKDAYASVAAEGIGLGKHRPVRVIVSTNRDGNPESNDTIIQNVQDQAEFLIAVREAWALSYLPSQLQQRLEERYPEKDLRIALLVQAMGEPNVSVHAYSCIPEDKEKTYLQVYEGELDVREKVVKDYYAISRQTLHIVTSELNPQQSKLERKDGGFTLVPANSHKEDKLIRRELEEVARLAKKAERILGEPVKLFLASKNDRHVLLWANRLGFAVDGSKETPPATPVETPPEETMEVVDIEPALANEPTFTVEEPAHIAQEQLVEEHAHHTTPQKSSNARLLAVSLRLATNALRKRYETLFGKTPEDFPALIAQLNERNAFPHRIDEQLLRKAHDAVERDASLSDDEYARAVEEISFLLAHA